MAQINCKYNPSDTEDLRWIQFSYEDEPMAPINCKNYPSDTEVFGCIKVSYEDEPLV